jgi:hypothetical protein
LLSPHWEEEFENTRAVQQLTARPRLLTDLYISRVYTQERTPNFVIPSKAIFHNDSPLSFPFFCVCPFIPPCIYFQLVWFFFFFFMFCFASISGDSFFFFLFLMAACPFEETGTTGGLPFGTC